MTITCARCGATEDFNTRSEERFGKAAADAGWLLWLPYGKAWCPTCHHQRHPGSTVKP